MPIQELMISELPALPPVPSGEIPVSQMNGTALVTCKVTAQQLVQSVAPRQHSHTPADIGLGNVNNTSDANKPVSTPQLTAIAAKVDKNQARLDGRIHEKLNPLGSVAGSASINLAGGSYVTATATGACTWTFSGTLAGYATAFTLQLENGGLGAQGFPATPMGTAPTLQAAGVDVLVFAHDGTAWRYAKAGA